MSKHTAGPWTIEAHGDGFALYSGRGPMMHGLNLINMAEPDKNWEANARLIAAAPDLLEAGRSILDTFEAWDGMSECPVTFGEIEALRNAIAKAEGA